MTNVIFVVPYALETTLRFLRSTAHLPGVRLGIVSQEPPERFQKDLAGHLHAVERVSDCLDPDQLEAGVRRIARRMGGEVDRLIGVLEQLQEPLAEVRERLGLGGMPLAAAKNFRDKARMKTALREHDVPCARHRLISNAAEGCAFGESSGYPLVVKPPDGAGARNTFRVEDEEQLLQALRISPPSPGTPVLLEEFIQGDEYSFDSVSVDGKHLFHSISRYYPTPLQVMEAPWIQWCVHLPREIDGPEFEDIHAIGKRALDALGMDTGLTHMEWFRRTDGSLAVSEVAARPPGAQFTSLISYAHDCDFYRVWAETCVFGSFEPPERIYSVAAVFLRGQGTGPGAKQVSAVHGIEKANEELGSMVVQSKVPRPGHPRASTYEGEGYVILRDPDTAAVEAGMKRILELIRIELK